jgi:hypothetical protein
VNTLQIFEKKQARNYHQKIQLLCCIKQSVHEICGIAASLNVQLAVQDGHYLLEKWNNRNVYFFIEKHISQTVVSEHGGQYGN